MRVPQGALTHGDRRATETRDLSRFNFDNKVSIYTLPFKSLVSLRIVLVFERRANRSEIV
jgi:hypothetical protein